MKHDFLRKTARECRRGRWLGVSGVNRRVSASISPQTKNSRNVKLIVFDSSSAQGFDNGLHS